VSRDHTQVGEVTSGDEYGAFGLEVILHEDAAIGPLRDDVGEDGVVVPERVDHGRGRRRREFDQDVRIPDREPVKQRGVDDVKHRQGRADAQGEYSARGERESG
jgi:hypothetical protein